MQPSVKAHAHLQTLPLGRIVARGWIRDQLSRNKDGIGGHLDELEPNMIANPYVNCQTDEGWGASKAGWGAEISGNYWYGLIQLAFTLDDPELKQKAERWVSQVLANQRPNGYMGTYTDKDDLSDDYNAWGTHCGMKALLSYYEATGRKDVLEAVKRCLLWFCDAWQGDRKTRYAGGVIIESMAVCYLLTGEEKLRKFIDEYVDFLNRKDLYKNSANALAEEKLTYNSNHSAGYTTYIGVYAMAFKATGNPDYLKAGENGYRKAERQAGQRTGGLTCHAEYLVPPSASVETEYCCFSFLNNSLVQLSAITGDPWYADRIERIAFNGAQGARKKDEKAIAYMTSPNQIYANSKSSFLEIDMQQYAPCYPVSCCPVTSVWVIPDYVRSMGLTDPQGDLYIAAYGPARIDFGDLVLTCETQYPFRDRLSFQVQADKPAEKTIHFRIPGWCKQASFAVNGETVETSGEPGSFLPIRRVWKTGDRIEIRFPMDVSISRIDDSEGSAKYPLAVEYGPLLFSLQLPEVWTAVKGNPRTPLPEGWSWWDVDPKLVNDKRGDHYEQQGLRKYNITWNVALDEHLDTHQVQAEYVDGGYVWENPQIRLKVPGYKALYSYPPYIKKTMDVFQAPIDVQEPIELDLVPYGCTALRISYFPRANTSAAKAGGQTDQP